MGKASSLGVSLGSDSHKVSMSINGLLDSETDRAMVMLKKTAATKPNEDGDPSGLCISAIEFLCEDLAPESIEVPESHADILVPPGSVGVTESHADILVPSKKVIHKRSQKQSAPRHSSRNRFKTKFHDEYERNFLE